MSGILNNKERILDFILTKEGRRQLAEDGSIQAEFAVFSDGGTFYQADAISGSADAGSRIYFEATSLPQDQISFEADDSGKLLPYPGSNIVVKSGKVISGTISGSSQLRFITGSEFASLSEKLLISSIDNFKNLLSIGSTDFFRDDDEFSLSQTTANFNLTNNSPIKKDGIKNSSDLETFYSVLPECYRVLKGNGFFITFFSTKLLPEIFKKNPFIYHWQFILNCPLGSVRSPIGFSKYMSCLVFKKGNPKIIKWNKDIFNDSPTKMVEPDEGFINHPSPKPKQFISELLKMFSKENDLILDPFIGSGSTALACFLTNRNFIGFEIEKEYCNLAINRLEKLRYRNI